MNIEVPDQEIGGLKLSSAEAKIDFAVGLYTRRQVSLGRAARIAGIASPAFLQELGRRGICINYTTEDFEHDLRMIEKQAARSPDHCQ